MNEAAERSEPAKVEFSESSEPNRVKGSEVGRTDDKVVTTSLVGLMLNVSSSEVVRLYIEVL